MTCVIAYKEEGIVYLGWDSASISGQAIRKMGFAKVFSLGRFVIGTTGSIRMGQILRYHLTVETKPGLNDYRANHRYMVTQFIPEVRSCLKEYGYMYKENENEYMGEFLVVFRHNIYHINNDMQVGIYTDGFDVVGCGESYALAALKAMQFDPAFNGREKVEKALEIAAYYSTGVCEPFHFMERNAYADEGR
ncbi:hypothetical protein LCGC14_0466200 [marine sediment metagenome]|uniref:Proteasome endopeptidase complex n=1 Tax=marine sediment metagenome TaxID=412755 RepID=A0A0F9SDK6_9ZZZZ